MKSIALLLGCYQVVNDMYLLQVKQIPILLEDVVAVLAKQPIGKKHALKGYDQIVWCAMWSIKY